VLEKLRAEGIEIVEGAKVSSVSGKDSAVTVRRRTVAALPGPTFWSRSAVR
jgi:hypothetical protein